MYRGCVIIHHHHPQIIHRRHHLRMTPWHLATVIAVTAWKALALLCLMLAIFSYASPAAVDSLIEECIPAENNNDVAAAKSGPICRYVAAAAKYAPAGADDRCFVETLLALTIVVCAHYVLAAGLLLLGGVAGSRYLAFVPWLVLKLLLVLFAAVFALREVTFGGAVTVGEAAPMLVVVLFLSLASWFVGLMSCLLTKKAAESPEAEPRSAQRSFDYFRFD